MKFLNVEIPVKNLPVLDPGFVPLGLFFQAYEKSATQPLCIAVERGGGQIGTWECKVYGTPEMKSADEYYVDRLVKFLLWSRKPDFIQRFFRTRMRYTAFIRPRRMY